MLKIKLRRILDIVHRSERCADFFLFDGLYRNAAISGASIIDSITPVIGYPISLPINSIRLPENRPTSIDVR